MERDTSRRTDLESTFILSRFSLVTVVFENKMGEKREMLNIGELDI
jgi:hypothetical protein